MGNVNETIKEKDEAFFKEAFTNPVTQQPYKVPDKLKEASKRICNSYGIRGVCDPMYIANVIAMELGMGDGKGNFEPDIKEILKDIAIDLRKGICFRNWPEVIVSVERLYKLIRNEKL